MLDTINSMTKPIAQINPTCNTVNGNTISNSHQISANDEEDRIWREWFQKITCNKWDAVIDVEKELDRYGDYIT